MTEITEMACDILHATRDGDNLHQSDLALLQLAVNGNLNNAGIERFRELHHIIGAGDYNINERWKT